MSSIKSNLQKKMNEYNINLDKLPQPVLRTILQAYMIFSEKQSYTPEIFYMVIQKIINSGMVTEDKIQQTITLIWMIVEIFLRHSNGTIKADDLKDGLRETKLPNELIEDICKVLINHRESLVKNFYEIKSIRNAPKAIQWKINISLMESSISRLSQPTIILHIKKSDENFKTIEMTISMFHRLRFNIANILKEIQILENRQIMKK